MRLHGNARTCLHSRRLIVGRVIEEGWSLTAAAEAAGVSVRTVSKWLRRFRCEGDAGLTDRSSAPGAVPHRTSDDRVQAIASLRRLRMTAAEIAECLSMPLSTVSAVLARVGLGKLSRLEPPEPANRYERKQPGELLHIDIKKLGRIRGGAGHRITGNRSRQASSSHSARTTGWEYVHVCVDDATRLAYVEVLADEKATTAIGFLRRAVAHFAAHGIQVERVHDRQRLRLRLDRARARLQEPRDQTPPHPALPAAHQRQSRTLHPHHARRLGLRSHLQQLRRTPPSPQWLARLLQSPTTTRLPPPPTATTAAGSPQKEQPGWVHTRAPGPGQLTRRRSPL